MLTKRSPWLLLAPAAALIVGFGCLGDFFNPLAHAAGYGPLAPPARVEDSVGEPFALVELFTSQGCSSCPPADRVLAELGAEAEAAGVRVFPLSLHVDYWDRLGWPDPYASAEWSQRQRQHAMPSGRLYTPQAVINGDATVVGSKEGAVRSAIQQALATPAPAAVSLVVDGGVRWRVDGEVGRAVLRVALVQDDVSNAVPRGENAGRRLRHHHVVRELRTLELSGPHEGTLAFDLPEGVDPADAAVVAWVEDPTTLRPLGAASAPWAG